MIEESVLYPSVTACAVHPFSDVRYRAFLASSWFVNATGVQLEPRPFLPPEPPTAGRVIHTARLVYVTGSQDQLKRVKVNSKTAGSVPEVSAHYVYTSYSSDSARISECATVDPARKSPVGSKGTVSTGEEKEDVILITTRYTKHFSV